MNVKQWLSVALLRAAFLVGVPLALYVLLVRPDTSPLHPYSLHAVLVLAAWVVWVIASTVARYRYRLAHPVEAPQLDDQAIRLR